jgi:nucleoside-diphosphate-sugar epimerase
VPRGRGTGTGGVVPVPRRAVILGGTGAVGTATALRLGRSGWSVTVTGRSPSHVAPELASVGVTVRFAEREDDQALAELLRGGADLLVDCACYTAGHARALLRFLAEVGSTVMLSSKAVYVDGDGRHSNSPDPPRFPVPIHEAQPTVRPSDAPHDSAEGYGANKVAAEDALLGTEYPVTVLRLAKVHGAWARRPREWTFVKRVLDRRPAVFLARRGAGVDHTCAAVNVAALVEVVSDRPGRRVLNCADPDAPNGLEIARSVARWAGHSWEEVLLDDEAADGLGAHPWDAVPPIVLDTSAAAGLGYLAVGDFAATVVEELDWLGALWRAGDPDQLLPGDRDPFFGLLLDYAAEDRYLAGRSGG